MDNDCGRCLILNRVVLRGFRRRSIMDRRPWPKHGRFFRVSGRQPAFPLVNVHILTGRPKAIRRLTTVPTAD